MSLFSKNIRTLREKAGLKLSDFEQYGIKVGTMSNYELGRTEPKLKTVIFFSMFFRINIHLLLFRNLALLYKVERGEKLSDDELLQYQLEKQQAIKTYNNVDLLQETPDNIDTDSSEKLPPENYNQKTTTRKENHNQRLQAGLEECQIEYRKLTDWQNEEFKAEESDISHGIPLIPITALAGSGAIVFNDLQIEQYYVIPELKNAEFLIRMKGDSMYPRYSSGDLLACTKVLEITFYQWNKVYVIYTKYQGVMVKRVHQGSEPESIKLVSDNPNYPPFEILKNEVDGLAIVVGCVRTE